MNKYKRLTKMVAKTTVVFAGIAGGALAAYVGVGYFADSVAQQKTQSQGNLSADQGSLQTLKDQRDKSGVAERTFAQLQEKRPAAEYAAKKEELFDLLRSLNARYHFDKFNVSSNIKNIVSERPEFKELPYIVVMHPLKFDFRAVSDLHIFSWLEELRNTAPGLIRVDSIEIERKTDFTDGVYSQISNGAAPVFVDAKVELLWITIEPKPVKKDAPAQPGGQPDPAGAAQ